MTAPDQDVKIAAAVIAASPLIDAPKLPAENWMGLARHILEEVDYRRGLSMTPQAGERDRRRWEPTNELRIARNLSHVGQVERLQQKWRVPDFPKDQIEWRDVPVVDVDN